MGDLTIETRRVCRCNLFWQRKVPGSKGKEYTVLYAEAPRGAPYRYMYSCDCPAFQYMGRADREYKCKHIRRVEHERCTAGEDGFFGGAGLGDATVCPKCGAETSVIQIAT